MNSIDLLYCRLCAERRESQEIMDLVSNPDLRKEVLEKLSIFRTNCVDFSDRKLPEAVCIICYTILGTTNEFFDKIKISQVLLGNIVLDNLEDNSNFGTEERDTENEIKQELQDSNEKVFIKVSVESQICQNDSFNPSKFVSTWSTYNWLCKYCDMNLPSVIDLRSHCEKEHHVCNGYKCADCGTDCDNFNEFCEHVVGHRDELRHICPYCNIKIEHEQTEYHIALHLSQPTCSSCGNIFPLLRLLKKHTKQYVPNITNKRRSRLKTKIIETSDHESWKDYPWVCQYCMTRLPSQEMLRVHTKEVHNKCYGMQCADCSTIGRITCFKDFVEHAKRHRPNLKYYCQYCNYRFIEPEQRAVHINEHLAFRHQCGICGEIFENELDCEKHKYDYPPKLIRTFSKCKKTLTLQDLTCDICQKLCKCLKTLKSHKQSHMERNRDHTCDRCGRAFFTKGALAAHIIIHENPEPQVCKLCKKSFLTLTRLKKHVLTHSSEKRFQCNECKRRFRLKEQLKSHMITHSDEMPFSCQYCGKSFKFQNVMKVHENQHTGARPYSCSECSMTFANWSNCNKHTKRKHGKTIAKNMMTPQGKLPVNPKTGQVRKIKDLDMIKTWTEEILRSSVPHREKT